MPVLRLLPLFCLVLLSLCAHAAELPYAYELAKWKVVEAPSESSRDAHAAWLAAARESDLRWQVAKEGVDPTVRMVKTLRSRRGASPIIVPSAGLFSNAAIAPVDDGWLVGLNWGEFGGSLYWQSPDEDISYDLSHHQVVDFITVADGIYAIEGLSHLGASVGSVIRIARPTAGAHWEATTVAKLPSMPYTVSALRDGTLLIALYDGLLSIGPDRKIRTLIANAPWRGLFPNSSVLSVDESRLYIGMRQFVGEVDLATNKFRFLTPSEEFVKGLPK